jgi:hypothetical protein
MAVEPHDAADYRFLNDRPTEEDVIGAHSQLAESLLKIIHSDLQRPFVVGLFGAWGIGKSSTIEMLRWRVRHTGGDTKIVVIDAWRKEPGIFLRQFLKKLARKLLRADQAKEISDEIDKKKTVHVTQWKVGSVAWCCFWAFVLLVISLAVARIWLWVRNPSSSFPADDLAVLSLTALVATYFRFVLPKYSVHSDETTEDVTVHDVTHFRRIYDRIIERCRARTVCIVIDNLDRVAPEVAPLVVGIGPAAG